MLGAQRLLPDLQGVMEQVCGLFVLVLVSVEQPRGEVVRPGPGPWAGLTPAGQVLAELSMGVPTPPRSSTGSLHAQVAAKPLLPQASTPLWWGDRKSVV